MSRIDKFNLDGQRKMEGLNFQIKNIRNDSGNITIDSTEIKGLQKYYGQLFVNKIDKSR
jgi:hypothetical protein